jgi:Rrf2 family iron-sulfur cluster assembly transcriptional regulator
VIITREADYAVRLTVGLAAHGDGEVVSARALAETCEVPYELARTILGNLAETGVLESRRGRSGGFALARSASEIKLGQVLAAAGETLQLNICVGSPARCGRSAKCPVHPVWDEASQRLREFIGEKTLAEILNMSPVPASC